MMLPVFIPAWRVGDSDIPNPAIRQLFDHVLIFDTDDGVAADYYGNFGREISLTGLAVPLVDHNGGPTGAFPTELRCEGFCVYWSAPRVVSGPISVTGILRSEGDGAAPLDFPRVRGTITSLAEASLQYGAEDGSGISGMPTPGRQQAFRPVGSYPPHFHDSDLRRSPQMKLTGYVADVDTSMVDPTVVVDSPRLADRVLVRMFPDYARTVLWLFGPLPYPDARLTPELTAALQEWETSYYVALTPDDEWQSPTLAAAFTATGNSLDQRLADELGTGFAVEFQSYELLAPRHIFAADSPATNPTAASALAALAAADAAEKARLAAEDSVGWFAHAPLSGTYFIGSCAKPEMPES